MQIRSVMEHGESVAYGRTFPEFWVGRPLDGGLAMGAQCDGPPGLRPHYTPTYCAAFVRDLDGHKIEAMCFTGAAG